MTAASPCVSQIVELVGTLTDEERAELETALHEDDLAIGRAWAEEIDQRAARALHGDLGLSRDELLAVLRKDPRQARSALAQMLAARR